MRIGIDIDDTITNTHELLMKYAIRYDKKINGQGIKDISKYEFYDAFYWTKEDTKNFFTKYFQELLPKIKMKKQARDIINKLYDEGYEIYIVTHRTNRFIDDPYLRTKDWLDKNKLKYTKLLVNCTNKGKTCLENNIDLFIDDAIFNCVDSTNNNIDTLLYSTSCNLDDSTYRRVDNWKQIYKIIKEEYNGRKSCNK